MENPITSTMENPNPAKAKAILIEDDDTELKSVIGFQCEELMEAKTLYSDLDFAFALQMQEAAKASLSLHHPSTSQDVTVLPPSTSQDVPVLPPSTSQDVAVLPPPETGFDYLTAMLDDLDRFEVERRDLAKAQAEMTRVRDSLHRSVHDQNFASYIMSVPEEEWKKHGDNYERPYIDGTEVPRECFRVYVKGLVSEERMGETKVIVGGAGVAICDFRGNLVFEVSKKLEGAEFISAEMAGLEAVVEGLNVALNLDLKRITVFVDDLLVHQYVTGALQPRQSKMGTIVNEVACLGKKFSFFQTFLLKTRNDMKFAFKLARDAIVSQIAWSVETSNGRVLKETCLICFEDIDAAKMVSVAGCFHRFCFSCMKQHVEAKLLNGMVASCPHEGCDSEVTIDSCGKLLDPKLVEIVSNRKKEASIALSEKVYCAYPACSALMSKDEVLQYTKTVCLYADQFGARKCVKCLRFFCMYCKVPWHYDMTCNDYKRSNPHPLKEDAMLQSLATKKQWRQCIKCNNMVELAWGCYHITCRCGYEFCYTCGAQWFNKKPTCKCPIWDERNILDRQRRQDM